MAAITTIATADVFVTYAREDIAVVQKIISQLEQHGLRVLFDQKIPLGTEVYETLREYVHSAHIYLFVMSPSSLTSENCMHELDLARQLEKNIIPIRIAQVDPETVPMQIATIQWLEILSEAEIPLRMNELVIAIRDLISSAVSEDAVLINITTEDGASAEFTITDECLRTLQIAREICQVAEPQFQLSFTSILLALTIGDNEVTQLVNYYFKQASISVTPIMEHRRITAGFMTEVFTRDRKNNISSIDLRERVIVTTSAKRLFEVARQLSGNKYIVDTSHLLAAIIYRPEGHRSQLESYRIDRQMFSRYFLGYISQMHPDDLQDWIHTHRDVFPNDVTPEPIALPSALFLCVGPSPHIANDVWTTEDALGYRDYAYVLCHFLINEHTKPPLTIGIQAPWGGGKSSLMRMVQQLLDPIQIQKARRTAPTVLENITLTLGDFYKELKNYLSGFSESCPALLTQEGNTLWTVWFNAWKYENTNQVWAGLADAIINQVTDRMDPLEKEKFFLQLNLRRVDAAKIRQDVQQHVISVALDATKKILWVLGSLTVTAIISLLITTIKHMPAWYFIIPGGSSLAALYAACKAWKIWGDAKEKENNKPAVINMRNYLSIPNYYNELGFVHAVEADVRRILACIPENRPLVIFIDDLDRCSPTKVTQVVEGVNLFLAGDFNALFVMGMDSEMVAAALYVAHQSVADCLPREVGVPVGWHFMDKFVQLPFIIPPCSKQFQQQYLESLYIEDVNSQNLLTAAPQSNPQNTSHAYATDNETEPSILTVERIEGIINEGFASFNDSNPEIRIILQQALAYFNGNPRELKRFVNAFRLHYSIWWTLRSQGQPLVSLNQLLRWTVFTMKWPEVVRWVHRGYCIALPSANSSRLKQLELCAEAGTIQQWQEELTKTLCITKDDVSWYENRSLYEFFHSDINALPEDQRLSAGEGKGLW